MHSKAELSNKFDFTFAAQSRKEQVHRVEFAAAFSVGSVQGATSLQPCLRSEDFNIPKTILAILAYANAILGAYLVAFGTYVFVTSDIEFSNYSRTFTIVLLGLISIYVSDIATTGVLSASRAHVQMVAIIGLLLVLSELFLIVSMSWNSMKIEHNLQKTWMRIFNTNPLSLQRVEHYYGCCGFSDKKDMPSHPGCLKAQDANKVSGCATYLVDSAFYTNRMTIVRCTVAMILQILFLAIGWCLITGVLEPDTFWLADADNQEANWATGTAAVAADVPAADGETQNMPGAHMVVVTDSELIGGLIATEQPADTVGAGKATASENTNPGVTQHEGDASHPQETSILKDDSADK
ncbi:hypothetical protein COEREDRAFT_7968 [Coemansia reversa NRRL 1564]|uniref:Uncharacterized protein n=1 Tax=Coemansia reversa (strain ATCC 12441 / NRRL 1564) TaxID=763665 RepID=A0A2G5BDN2_COERN|nr:hypothetical protein COEREDRAFT_7968 [Coemansia reversa NRRL 1564]|eukprot:PIA16817.1 hypothetical protein COEREDRAFT_7968 [Coemansia reversa NRRL 1564]